MPLPLIHHYTKALVSWPNPTRGEVRSKMGQRGCIACLNMLTSNLTCLVPRQYNKTIHSFFYSGGVGVGMSVKEMLASLDSRSSKFDFLHYLLSLYYTIINDFHLPFIYPWKKKLRNNMTHLMFLLLIL